MTEIVIMLSMELLKHPTEKRKVLIKLIRELLDEIEKRKE